MVRRSTLEKIFQEIMHMRHRLDDIEKNFSNWKPQPLDVSESSLMKLPDHLRKTLVLVASKGEISAVEVSNLSGRCRALESSYLNQLSRMGLLLKRRKSKLTVFRIAATSVSLPLKMKDCELD
jgi:hypothetical protein